jgi:hypothetical protein
VRTALATALLLATGCVYDLVVDHRDGAGETAASSGDPTDGTLSCDGDKVPCDDKCASLDDDPDHCGACGEVCADDEACDGGTCSTTCSGGRTKCDRRCQDLQTDEDHCGDCEVRCGELERCAAGMCTCVAPLERCGDRCVYALTDPDHCGACFETCEGDACGLGECQPGGCPGGTTACGLSCVDLETHPLHCGQCDEACDDGKICIDADCRDP